MTYNEILHLKNIFRDDLMAKNIDDWIDDNFNKSDDFIYENNNCDYLNASTLSYYDSQIKMFSNDKKIHPLPKKFISLKMWPKVTNIHCWYCSCNFDTIPIFIPSSINQIETENEEHNLTVNGCFCSFNCAQSHINLYNKSYEDKINKGKMLCYLFKIFNGYHVGYIVPSMDKCELNIFGGNITLDQFRKENENRNQLMKTIYGK